MKRFEFIFKTTIRFDSPITDQHFLLKCLPGNYPFQHVYDEQLVFTPSTQVCEGTDSFGNRILWEAIRPRTIRFPSSSPARS